MTELELRLLAQASAHRNLLVKLFTHRFLEEPDPLGAAQILRQMVTKVPTTVPAEGSNLDAASSDLLAAMTDEAVECVMDGVIQTLETLQGIGSVQPTTSDPWEEFRQRANRD